MIPLVFIAKVYTITTCFHKIITHLFYLTSGTRGENIDPTIFFLSNNTLNKVMSKPTFFLPTVLSLHSLLVQNIFKQLIPVLWECFEFTQCHTFIVSGDDFLIIFLPNVFNVHARFYERSERRPYCVDFGNDNQCNYNNKTS